jgi:hypothetical protein
MSDINYIQVLQDFKMKMIDELIEEKQPFSKKKDQDKARHIAYIVFNSLLEKILPGELEAWRRANNIILKSGPIKKEIQ